MRRENLESFATVVLVVCAMATSGAVVYKALSKDKTVAGGQIDAPRLEEQWPAIRGISIPLRGSAESAPMQLIEFSDFECPACGSFHRVLEQIDKDYPGVVGVRFVHYPLVMHQYAEKASQVADCAAEQGRFAAMHDALFESQREFGVISWAALADRAEVRDKSAFQACIERPATPDRVQKGKEMGDEMRIKGTPTVLINGWMLPYPPTYKEVRQMILALKKGKDPIKAVF
jgi:protein-disulfide isomerase